MELEKGGWRAINPPSISENEDALRIMNEHWRQAERCYQELRDAGIRKEDARFVLPNAAETRIVVTMGDEGWKHFVKLRADKAAQWEIRRVAEVIAEVLSEISWSE